MAQYEDFVIKDGRLIADFEGLYENFPDPWNQSQQDQILDSRRQLAVLCCERLRSQSTTTVNRVLEVGCGFGFLTDALRQRSFACTGIDISPRAVEKARELHPSAHYFVREFADPDLLSDMAPDCVIFAEVTWYILHDLEHFMVRLRDYAANRDDPVFFVHLLTTYADGVQKYGREYFSDLNEILAYFGMSYLEYGFIQSPRPSDPDAQGTYFVAQVPV
jgi:predicted TPR repeat methyltransferase